MLEDRFLPGDKIIVLRDIKFDNGEEEKVGQLIVVTKETDSYYNVCREHYRRATEYDVYLSELVEKCGKIPRCRSIDEDS